MTMINDLKPVVELLHRANTKLKFPTIKVTEPTPLKLYIAGSSSKWAGAIQVTNNKPYGDVNSLWYGRIDIDGHFIMNVGLAISNPEMTLRMDTIIKWLRDLASDPAKIALAYSQKTCNCMFCNRKLTTTASRTVGYGPICADTFGLPWGETPTQNLLDL